MRLLIDGYNLLHVTDLFGRGDALGTLHGSREALLEFLALALTASERRATTIVFDAAGAPPGLPATIHFDHITARFARNYPDADTLLEEIIEAHRAPRGLLVVSSDHRVSRAGRRRGAKTIDSENWFAQQQLAVRQRGESLPTRTRPGKDSGASAAHWIREFTTPEMADLERQIRQTPAATPLPSRQTKPKRTPSNDTSNNLENPFPPGYADDLLADE
jgi:predicted RNA-binding protein with PIN domain